jgi:hypothetical protein
MDRREFLAKAGLAATWAGIAVRVSACGDEGDGGTQPAAADAVGAVTGGGHSHSGAVVTEAELSAGNAVTLTLTGSGHTHTVQLSAPQVMAIAGGQTVSVTSSMDAGHTHTVTFN